MLFAPSTIAIAALILSFSILLMDCTLWLNTIPNFCLPLHEENPSESCSKNFRDSNHSNVQKSKYLESYYRLDMNKNSKECSKNQFESIHDKNDKIAHDFNDDKIDHNNSQYQPTGQRHQQSQNNQNGQFNDHQQNQQNQQNQSHLINRIEIRNINKYNSLDRLANRKWNPSLAKQNRNNRFFDIDNCLNCFKFVEAKYSPCKTNKNSTNSSPISIAALPECETNDRKVTFSYEYLDFSAQVSVDNLKNIEFGEKKEKSNIDIRNDINSEMRLAGHDVSRNLEDDFHKDRLQVDGRAHVDNPYNNDNDNDNDSINKNIKKSRNKHSNDKIRSVSSNSLLPTESKHRQVSVFLAGELECPTRSLKTNNFSNHFSNVDDVDNRLRKRIIFDDIDCNNGPAHSKCINFLNSGSNNINDESRASNDKIVKKISKDEK